MSEVVRKNLGGVTAYAYARSKGYTGTEDEFAQLMANYATVGQAAEEAAEQAIAAEINAESAAQTATTKASEASSSATSASSSASAAATSETNAAASATAASGSATAAATSATAAQTAQTAAETAQTAAEAVLESIPEDYSELSDDVSGLKNALEYFVTENEKWNRLESTPTRIENYRIDTSGNNYADSNGSIVYLTINETGKYKITPDRTTNTYCFVYNLSSVSSVSDFVAANRSGSRVIFSSGSATVDVAQGQTIAMSSNSKTFSFVVDKYSSEYIFNDDIGLTSTMRGNVRELLADNGANYSLSTDATFYVDKIPSYYIDPPTTPTAFSEVLGYLDNKIASIPKDGKSFIFITDTHWDGNEGHSPDLISYICRRTGINKILYGGDLFGNANNKYIAARKANGFLLPIKRSNNYNLIACVGDHDNNTINVTRDADHFLPYEQVEELFVGDIERHPEYYWCDCSAKLATYATPGTDDYNEAIAFFHTVFCVDDDIQKIRYVSLNCGNGGDYGSMYNIFGTSGSSLLRLQLDWLAETLMSTPTGYDIVVLSHKGNTDYAGTAATCLNSIISGFKWKNSNVYPHPSSALLPNIDSWWPNTTKYDFSNAPDVGFVITVNGHAHKDSLKWFGRLDGTSYNSNVQSIASGATIIQPDISGNTCQIPIITTNCDSLGAAESSSPSMTADTVTEQCFDVITLVEDGIVLTRIGAGDDRRLYISKIIPS